MNKRKAGPTGEASIVAQDRGSAQINLRFRDLLEAAPDAILEVEQNGAIVLLNEAAETLFGYQRQELLEQSVEMLIPEALRQQHVLHRKHYAEDPVTRPMASGLQLRALRRDGSEFPAEISLSPIRSDQGNRVIAIVRDISARRQAEARVNILHERHAAELAAANRQLELRNDEVERANRLKSDFLASMSHELRTPLHTIIGFADLLNEEMKGPLNQDQRRYVDYIRRDSRHLLGLINDILDLSGIEADRIELLPESFDTADAIMETLADFRSPASGKQIEIAEKLEPFLSITADRERFKQIFYHLIGNAIKFTPEKGRITIESAQQATGRWFSVRDTGIGIPQPEHEAIFDKFYQVAATTRGVKEGTGLGLTITKKLVQMHGGEIRVTSKSELGSQFEIFLPEHIEPPARNSSVGHRDPLAILLVGLDPAACDQLADSFGQDGYTIHSASTHKQALEKARKHCPAAIVLNVRTQGACNWETLREIRSQGALETVPIVTVIENGNERMARSLGATTVLTAPTEAGALRSALNLCLLERLGFSTETHNLCKKDDTAG